MTPPTSPSSSMIMAKMKSEMPGSGSRAVRNCRAFADNITGGNGDACMGYLRVFVYIEFRSGNLLVICELLDTGTPRVEPVQERYVAVLRHQEEGDGDDAYRCQTAD